VFQPTNQPTNQPLRILLLGIFLISLAGSLTVCSSRNPITNDFFEQGHIAWVSDSTGRVHVVYNQVMGTIVIQGIPYPVHYVYYRNNNPVTQNLSAPVQLGSTLGHWGSTMPDIAVDSNDKCHVVWTESPVTTDSSEKPVKEKRRIMYTFRTSLGIWLEQPEQISSFYGEDNGPASQCRWPDVEIDSLDRPQVIWSGRSPGSSHTICDVFYNYRANGQWKYLDTYGSGFHGLNITNAVQTGLFGTFLVQQPRFDIDEYDTIHLAYRCNYKFPDQPPQAPSNKSAFYANGNISTETWSDPIGCEIADTYLNKHEVDIELHEDSGIFRPYITYSNYVADIYYSDESFAFTEIDIRLSYQDIQGTWQDQSLYQSTPQHALMDHFPCFCMDGLDMYVAIKVSPVIQPPLKQGDVSHINKIYSSPAGSPVQILDVDDTAGIGYTSDLGFLDDDITIIYRDTESTMLGLKPNLFFYSE